ncbi:MAG: hypothetical protein KAS32_14695, partial [Candidatus Peribacteraceae bacterium]|nr:hypothetical protein [Candidatus Peribacteraceae bacterium]
MTHKPHTILKFNRKDISRTTLVLGTHPTLGSFRAVDLSLLSVAELSALRICLDTSARRNLHPNLVTYLEENDGVLAHDPSAFYQLILKDLLPKNSFRCFKPADCSDVQQLTWDDIVPAPASPPEGRQSSPASFNASSGMSMGSEQQTL